MYSKKDKLEDLDILIRDIQDTLLFYKDREENDKRYKTDADLFFDKIREIKKAHLRDLLQDYKLLYHKVATGEEE